MTAALEVALPFAPGAFPEPVAQSSAMRDALAAARDVAFTPTTVLLLGESGAGKEVLARYIHARSPRRSGPFAAVECAALSSDPIDPDVFGAAGAGAFDGGARPSCFEQARGGTLLLDEISELPLGLQARLLCAIQARDADGGNASGPAAEVRIIATARRDLLQMVNQGLFRSDLYYRLNVFPIVVPPLRDRREDLPALAEQLLADAAIRLGRSAPALGPGALQALSAHDFPGNVRELRNLLERALVRCRGAVLEARLFGPDALPAEPRPLRVDRLPPGLPLDLTELERLAIQEALLRVNGNRTRAARLLGIGLRTLRNRLRLWRESGSSSPGLHVRPELEEGLRPAELRARSLP